MPVRAAECLRRRRREARQRGLCIVCFGAQPPVGRATCRQCSSAAAQRVARWRKCQAEQRKVAHSARIDEAAGDLALSRFSYLDAQAQYERALANLRGPSNRPAKPEDDVRLTEKLGLALFYGSRPDLATPWLERAVELRTEVASLRQYLPTALQRLPRQRWLESRTTEALDFCSRAKEVAIQNGDRAAVRNAEVSAASWLVLLGRYGEARDYVDPNDADGAMVSAAVRADRILQDAIILATQGRAPAAFAEFERAVDVARECPDGYLTTVIWDDYANWSTALGRIDVARPCRERALFVARERRVAWRIPYLTIRLAGMLVMTGDYQAARDLLHDALTYDTETPVLSVLACTVGIEIALALSDDSLLRRLMRKEVLELAFRSGEPERIAPLAAAFAKAWIGEGQVQRARRLVHRACVMLRQADHAGAVLSLAAQYGTSDDALLARNVLMRRAKIPHGRVAQADLALWEAYAARRRRLAEATELARHAARLFGRLGSRHRTREALALAGEMREQTEDHRAQPLASHLSPSLTRREREVAGLVLRGLTNRAIAEHLTIAQHTVETHVTSILNRLGLRSRWQLIDLARK
jgi:ATP/maltotriose-dependent transcriptional regulator MalT